MSLDYASLLGDEAESLLNHKAVVPASSLHLPGPDHFDSVWGPSDRSPQVLRSLQRSTDMVVWQTRGISRFFQWIKASNMLPALLLPRTLSTLTVRTLSNLPLKAVAMLWRRPSASFQVFHGNTPTASHSSSKSTTTNC